VGPKPAWLNGAEAHALNSRPNRCLFMHFLGVFNRHAGRHQGGHPPALVPRDSCPFSAPAFNVGPVALARPHKDVMNLSWGWCVVMSLGSVGK
jgi:hypothetical protein